MHLKKWLVNNGLTYQEFAEKIGIHRQTIVNLMAGKDVMLSVACKIEDATLGVVKCRELHLDDAKDEEKQKRKKQQQQDDTTANTPIGLENAG
jgi:plasmid maintenance system antidote protein VapI